MKENLPQFALELAEERKNLILELQDSPAGLSWCERHSELADRAVKAIYHEIAQQFDILPIVSVIATGGYGRQELAPYSDIDITVVPEDESSKEVDLFVRKLYQGIHNVFETALKMRVGYAYRLISDAPGVDHATRAGLLDARRIVGARYLATSLEDALATFMPVGEFLIAKLEERDANFSKFGGTPLAVQPQLKEGAGGLRCFHCANWMRAAIGERPTKPGGFYDSVLKIRNLLHLVSGKLSDHLVVHRQPEIAEILKIDPYAMMSDLIGNMVELHSDFLRTKEKVLDSRFKLSAGVHAVRGEARINANSDAGDACIGVALATYLGLRIEEGESVPVRGISGPEVLYALSKGEPTIRNLDRCGLLEIILPELTACRTLVPQDGSHDYTVFEHTIRVVRNIFNIEPNSPLGTIRAGTNDLPVLILAALVHDVGKLVDEDTHSEIGARIVRDICKRWGLDSVTADLASWLIQEHLSMSRFIHLRDVSNPRTIEDFILIVRTRERLDLLTLLTYADISAVSGQAWTPVLGTYLLDLYGRSVERLTLRDPNETHAEEAQRRRVIRHLKGSDVDESEVQVFVASLPASFLTNATPESMRLQFQLAQRAKVGEIGIDIIANGDLSASDVTICALDRPGLLAQILGVFYALDLSLLALRATTTETEPPIALDVFSVSFAGRPIPVATSNQLIRELESILAGESVDGLLKARGKDSDRRHRLSSYAYLEGDPGILEIQSPRGRGMAYRFTRLLSAQGWNVLSARVGQWAGTGAAAFYITGPNHSMLTKEQVDAALGALG